MNIKIDLNAKRIPTDFSWQFGMGNDHAATLLRTDVAEHIKRIHAELGIKYIRFHGIFDDDMLCYQALGDNANFGGLPKSKQCCAYNFHEVGRVYDNVLAAGLKPFVELSFMPSRLASGSKRGFPHRRYWNNITMPKSLAKWQEFIRAFIRFIIDRYGKEEVESWYFEVWNEPDLGCFFKGSQKDYFKLYKATAEAVKSVDPALKVGGPSTSACRWVGDFVAFCKQSGSPVDFVTTHHYPGDGFGNTFTLSDAFKMMGVSKEAAAKGTKLGEIYKKLFFKPQVYAKWHRGVLKELDEKALKEAAGLPLYITEWNSMAVFGSPVHDEKYSSAFLVRACLDLENKLGGYMFWCMSDVFEEMALIGEPFHGSFGIISIDGIPKPNFWAFKLLSMLCKERLETQGKAKEGVEYAAFTDGEKVQVLLFDQSHDYNRHEKTDVTVELAGAYKRVNVYKIDDTHCNPKKVWQEMGAPAYISPETAKEIERRSCLTPETLPFGGKMTLNISTNDVVMLEFLK